MVFDSGVGGLSIATAIKDILPSVSLVSVMDNGAFPYGKKDEEELIDRIESLLIKLLDKFRCDMVVIACNTASTVVLPKLRSRFLIPIVGVVPAIKPASKLSKTKSIGILATEGTIKRVYLDDLIDQFASECTIVKVGTNALVEMAEQKLRNEAVDLQKMERILDPFFSLSLEKPVDAVVLGCTHFPLLKDELKRVSLGRSIEWVDSSLSIANRVKYLFENSAKNRTSLEAASLSNIAIFTREDGSANALFSTLKKLGFDEILFFE